jgi:hypothetical protein
VAVTVAAPQGSSYRPAPAPAYRPAPVPAPTPAYSPAPAPAPAPAYAPAPKPAYGPAEVYADVAPQYNFEYAVSDSYSNNFGHSESRDGYKTSGSYRVILPDSRTQIVTYTADENGYVADVKYEGEAVFPAEVKSSYAPAPAPAYAPAPAPAPAPAYRPAPTPAYRPAPAPYSGSN